MTLGHVLHALAAAGTAAAEALERGDLDALAAALDQRDRLQAEADPLLAALQAPGTPRLVVEEARDLAHAVHACDGVLTRSLTARRDAVRAEMRRLDTRADAVNSYAALPAGDGRLRAVG